jgi:hypothetical protein
MPKPRVREHYTYLPPPPPMPQWCANEAAEIASHLTRKHRARKWQLEYLLGMLHERYLVSLPRLKRDTTEIYNTSPQQLQWLWYSWASKLLGWKQRRPEGHTNGFSPAVYAALRNIMYPFPKVERQEDNHRPSVPQTADLLRQRRSDGQGQHAGEHRQVQHPHAGRSGAPGVQAVWVTDVGHTLGGRALAEWLEAVGDSDDDQPSAAHRSLSGGTPTRGEVGVSVPSGGCLLRTTGITSIAHVHVHRGRIPGEFHIPGVQGDAIVTDYRPVHFDVTSTYRTQWQSQQVIPTAPSTNSTRTTTSVTNTRNAGCATWHHGGLTGPSTSIPSSRPPASVATISIGGPAVEVHRESDSKCFVGRCGDWTYAGRDSASYGEALHTTPNLASVYNTVYVSSAGMHGHCNTAGNKARSAAGTSSAMPSIGSVTHSGTVRRIGIGEEGRTSNCDDINQPSPNDTA